MFTKYPELILKLKNSILVDAVCSFARIDFFRDPASAMTTSSEIFYDFCLSPRPAFAFDDGPTPSTTVHEWDKLRNFYADVPSGGDDVKALLESFLNDVFKAPELDEAQTPSVAPEGPMHDKSSESSESMDSEEELLSEVPTIPNGANSVLWETTLVDLGPIYGKQSVKHPMVNVHLVADRIERICRDPEFVCVRREARALLARILCVLRFVIRLEHLEQMGTDADSLRDTVDQRCILSPPLENLWDAFRLHCSSAMVSMTSLSVYEGNSETVMIQTPLWIWYFIMQMFCADDDHILLARPWTRIQALPRGNSSFPADAGEVVAEGMTSFIAGPATRTLVAMECENFWKRGSGHWRIPHLEGMYIPDLTLSRSEADASESPTSKAKRSHCSYPPSKPRVQKTTPKTHVYATKMRALISHK